MRTHPSSSFAAAEGEADDNEADEDDEGYAAEAGRAEEEVPSFLGIPYRSLTSSCFLRSSSRLFSLFSLLFASSLACSSWSRFFCSALL